MFLNIALILIGCIFETIKYISKKGRAIWKPKDLAVFFVQRVSGEYVSCSKYYQSLKNMLYNKGTKVLAGKNMQEGMA